MTVIVYRNGVMASDTGCWYGDAKHPWASKLAKAADGALYGVAGNAAECRAFLEWAETGADPATMPKPAKTDDGGNSFTALAVLPVGSIRLITAAGYEEYDEAPYIAIGGGAEVAYGALFAGASAVRAVKAAIAHSPSAHGKVTSIEHATADQIRAIAEKHAAAMERLADG